MLVFAVKACMYEHVYMNACLREAVAHTTHG